MVSTWSSGSTLSGKTFDEATQDITELESCFTFVDFLPECRDPGGLFSKPEYETFRTLIDRANNWLRANPMWELKTCESVEFKAKGDHIDSDKMVYLEYGEAATWYIRGLRLWLAERTGDEIQQQIGYLNLLPEQVNDDGMFSSPTFESLDDVVARFNTMIQTRPIPGRIITVESQEMKMSNLMDLEPDKSCWVERGSNQNHFLFVIRIFFDLSEGTSEEIGIMDFMPDKITSGGLLSLPQYQPFSEVVEKASNWCMKQQGIRICNAQSLDIKIKTGQEADTQKMNYTEHGGRATFFVRILRVAYTKPQAYLNTERDSPCSLNKLTCKTIVPVQLTSDGLFIPEFETLQETKNRVSAWIKATGSQIISAETAALRIRTGGETKHGTEASFTFNQAERDEYWIFVIRLYISGSYHEPPEEMLPPVPELEDQHCCIIF